MSVKLNAYVLNSIFNVKNLKRRYQKLFLLEGNAVIKKGKNDIKAIQNSELTIPDASKCLPL